MMLGISPGAAVVDDAVPVEAMCKVVGVAVDVGVRSHVVRHVLALGLDSEHISWQLKGQQPLRLKVARDDV